MIIVNNSSYLMKVFAPKHASHTHYQRERKLLLKNGGPFVKTVAVFANL